MKKALSVLVLVAIMAALGVPASSVEAPVTVEEMFQVGEDYYFGNGVPQDYGKAVEWLQKAAAEGYAAAQERLGVCYYYGRGVEQNFDMAVILHTEAAEQGFPAAQRRLGFYCEMDGDYEKAIEWYTMAAEQGDAQAQNNLAGCYFQGLGVSQDYEKAAEWYARAAEQGNADAQYTLAYLYENGLGVIRSVPQAIEWYEKAYSQGRTDAKKAVDDLIQSENADSSATPETAPTPQPKVERIIIFDEYGRGLTSESEWPTVCVGESITLEAVVYPMDILNPVVEWVCYDMGRKTYPLTLNDDGTVTFTCTSVVPRELIIQASSNGYFSEIHVHQCEAWEKEYKAEDLVISDAFADDVAPVEKGDIVSFGSYEQDNDVTNGKEPIAWQVVKIQDGKALLLSKDVLDYQEYHFAHGSITWEECAICAWLNDSFLNAAFTTGEQNQLLPVIINTDITFADDTSLYNGNAGDKVFLLSATEMEEYFPSVTDRTCRASEYARVYGCLSFPDNGNTWWWLRPRAGYTGASFMNHQGYIGYAGEAVDNKDGIRPAVWISLSSLDPAEVKMTDKAAEEMNLTAEKAGSLPESIATPLPKVESVKITDQYGRDLTPEYAWPTLCPGESLTMKADVYPMDILNPAVEWSWSDSQYKDFPLMRNEDGTVTFFCTGTDPEVLRLTAESYGTSATISIYQREPAEVSSEAENQQLLDAVLHSQPAAEPEVLALEILNENDEAISQIYPSTLLVGETITLHASVFPEDVQNPEIIWSCSDINGLSVNMTTNADGSVTLTCLSTEIRDICVTAKSGKTQTQALFKPEENPKGKISVTDEVLFKPEESGKSAYYFARIENVSDEPVIASLCHLKGRNGEELVFEYNYVSLVPVGIILNPGEHAFVEKFIYDNRLEGTEITSYEYKVELENVLYGESYGILPSEAEVITDKDGTVIIRYILSNNTEETIYPSCLVGALYDENDKLVYVTSMRLNEELGIYPGSTVSLDEYLEESIQEYYQENGIVPKRADSILYIQTGEENVAW